MSGGTDPKPPFRRNSDLTPDEQKEVVKQAFKEGLKEWLNEKVTELGWFSLRFLGCALLAALVIFILKMNGWHWK